MITAFFRWIKHACITSFKIKFTSMFMQGCSTLIHFPLLLQLTTKMTWVEEWHQTLVFLLFAASLFTRRSTPVLLTHGPTEVETLASSRHLLTTLPTVTNSAQKEQKRKKNMKKKRISEEMSIGDGSFHLTKPSPFIVMLLHGETYGRGWRLQGICKSTEYVEKHEVRNVFFEMIAVSRSKPPCPKDARWLSPGGTQALSTISLSRGKKSKLN